MSKMNMLLESDYAWKELKGKLCEQVQAGSRRNATAVCLENARKYLLENASAGAVNAGNVAVVQKVMMPLIKRIMPTVIAHDLVGVQPMTGPRGFISTLKYDYRTTSPADGSGIIAGTEALSPFELGVWYSGNEDVSNPGAADTALLEGTVGNQMGISIVREDVVAKTRRLSARFTLEMLQDAESQYGINAESEISNALATQIVLDVDQEIVSKLYSVAGLPVDEYDQQKTSGVATSVVDQYAALANLLNRHANDIARKTRQGPANWALMNYNTISVIQGATASQFSRTTEGTFEAPTNNKMVGVLNNSIKIYANNYSNTDDILLGLKGSDEAVAAAYYCPYIPVLASGVVTDPNTFENVIGLMTRYAFVALTNPSTSLGNSQDFLAKITVKNLTFI